MTEGFSIIIQNYLSLPFRIFAQYYQDIERVVTDPLETNEGSTPVLRWFISTARGIIVIVGVVLAAIFGIMLLVLLFTKPFGFSLLALLWFLLVYPLFVILSALSVELLALALTLANDVHRIAEVIGGGLPAPEPSPAAYEEETPAPAPPRRPRRRTPTKEG